MSLSQNIFLSRLLNAMRHHFGKTLKTGCCEASTLHCTATKYQSPHGNSQCVGNTGMSWEKLFLAKLLSMEQPMEWAAN